MKMDTVSGYPGLYAALSILYFSCDDVDGLADARFNESELPGKSFCNGRILPVAELGVGPVFLALDILHHGLAAAHDLVCLS